MVICIFSFAILQHLDLCLELGMEWCMAWIVEGEKTAIDASFFFFFFLHKSRLYQLTAQNLTKNRTKDEWKQPCRSLKAYLRAGGWLALCSADWRLREENGKTHMRKCENSFKKKWLSQDWRINKDRNWAKINITALVPTNLIHCISQHCFFRAFNVICRAKILYLYLPFPLCMKDSV